MPPRPRVVPFTLMAEEVATTAPVAFVERTELGMPRVRLVVEAVPKNPSPEIEKTEVEAPPLKVWSCDQALLEVRRLDPVTRQVPFTLKQPVRMLMPLPAEVVAEPMVS